MRSGSKIILKHGFHAKQGSNFRAYIDASLSNECGTGKTARMAGGGDEDGGRGVGGNEEINAQYSKDNNRQMAANSTFTNNSTSKSKGGTSGQTANNFQQPANNSEISNQQSAIKNQQFQLYPNPNNGTMQMDYHLQDGENGELIIYDVTGRRVKRVLLNSQNNFLKIEEPELKAGVYFYNVTVNNQILVSEKLVVIK